MRLCLLLALALPLSADGLSSLRATLRKLPGGDAVKATVDHAFTRETVEDKKPTKAQGRVAVSVEDGAQGLRLGWGRPVLSQAAQEARQQARDPEATTGTRSALKAIDAVEADELMNYAGAMLRALESAELLEEKDEAWQGRPARLLRLKVAPKLPAAQKKYVKSLTVEARVWVAPDGTPLASSHRMAFKASRFFISFEGSQQEERRFQRVGNRLVVTFCDNRERNSGFGQTTDSQKTTTVTVN